MKLLEIYNKKAVILQLLLYAMPSIAVIFLVMYNINTFFAFVKNDWLAQGGYFALGITLSTIFYAKKYRISTTLITLFLLYSIAFWILGKIPLGNFDIFYITIQLISFTSLFSLGWIAGYGFSRWNGFTIAWVFFILSTQIYVISRTNNITANNIIAQFFPLLFYCFYIIFITELIKKTDNRQKRFNWIIFKKMLGFLLLLTLIAMPIFSAFNKRFIYIEDQWKKVTPNYEERKKEGESLISENKNGGIENKDRTQLAGNLNKGKKLVFVAKLENTFNSTNLQNPLYFVSYYFTKFDEKTQTFERDSTIPNNDLFKPNPASIPLYFYQADSSLRKKTLQYDATREINVEVYKSLLSASDFLAPATAYFCQPISVPTDYRQQFKSAYRAKIIASDLNSAYFIYNPAGDPILEIIQNERFAQLRSDTNYHAVDTTFMQYYTQFPTDSSYQFIKNLAQSITEQSSSTIDKIIAIRDYFLSKDAFEQPLFQYSDNPGIPGIPSANKLKYFLQENRKGYCAYFAGATLFLLRSLGIPSRLAAGFLTIDRSGDKNKGWYWFYEDQAHAWVQVYFPSYGWLDFDTTIPDLNTQQSAQPDGTPPIGIPSATFVADGHITHIDTIQKNIIIRTKKLLIKNNIIESSVPVHITHNASLAIINKDTGRIAFSELQKGMHITAVSFSEDLKNLPSTSFNTSIKALPSIVDIDEIKVIEKKNLQKQEANSSTKIDFINWLKVGLIILSLMLLIIILLFCLPFIIWRYYKYKAQTSIQYQQKAILFLLNQLGYYRSNESISDFAHRIDQDFNTQYQYFIYLYQKKKYSHIALSEEENIFAKNHLKATLQQINKNIPIKNRIKAFMNIYATLYFFHKQ